MKNKIILCLILVLVLVTGCFNKKEDKNDKNTDAIKFKEEYESLNKDNKYLNIIIKENNPIRYSNQEEIIDIINNKTGIIYLGSPDSNWCRSAITVLLEAAKQTGIGVIYYLNINEIKDNKILEILNSYSSEYKNLDLELPFIIFVKDGKIVHIHKGTLESIKDTNLNEDQTKELLNIYKDNIHKVLDDLCDQAC